MINTLAIRPSKDLRTNYAEISKLCRQQPVAVTVNGKEDIVVQSHEDFMNLQIEMARMKAELEVFNALAQSEDDIRLGRTTPVAEARRQSLARLKDYGV